MAYNTGMTTTKVLPDVDVANVGKHLSIHHGLMAGSVTDRMSPADQMRRHAAWHRDIGPEWHHHEHSGNVTRRPRVGDVIDVHVGSATSSTLVVVAEVHDHGKNLVVVDGQRRRHYVARADRGVWFRPGS